MSTHINAPDGAIAEVVLLPGDPLRAKFIAENFLENAVCYNEVRGMFGFTGTYKGKKVSVQGTGMGQPSLSIYAQELFQFYNVQKAVRIGTCGSIREDVKVRDIIIANHIRFNTDLAYNEDFNFIAKYLVFAHRISKVDRALYHYDESNMSSALHQKNSRQSKDEYHSQVDVMKFYSRHNFYEMCKKPLNHRVVRCLYFYRNPQIDVMKKSIISFFDIVTCPHIGIRGKFYVAFRLFFPYTLSSIIHDP